MRHVSALLIHLIVLILFVVIGAPRASYARDDGAVGYTTVTVPLGDAGSIPCAVWYPALDGTSRAVYDFGRGTRTGSAFTGAAPDTRSGPYPLVVYSHGYSGCSTASAYLCEALAAAGFVVAAPDHSDDLKICTLCPGYRPELFVGFKILFSAMRLGKSLAAGDYDIEDFRYRFIQITSTIDHLLAESRDDHSPFSGLIDAEHIGAVGHSLGGFSVMIAAGARDVGIDFPIDAVVAMSQPGGDIFTCADMKQITIPMMLMYGGEEELKREKGSGLLAQYRCLAGPKFLMALIGGNHLTFSEGIFFDSSLSDKRTREVDALHDLISRRVTAFFELYLTNDNRAKRVLEEKDPRLSPSYFSF